MSSLAAPCGGGPLTPLQRFQCPLQGTFDVHGDDLCLDLHWVLDDLVPGASRSYAVEIVPGVELVLEAGEVLHVWGTGTAEEPPLDVAHDPGSPSLASPRSTSEP